jgi:hypothetical protein
MSADREIGHLLTDLGFCGDSARAAARAVLVEAGLFNPKKTRVSDEKLPRIEALLTERFARACSDRACQAALLCVDPSRTLVVVEDARCCEHCQGSDNHKAMLRLSSACLGAGLTRLVVVGGSPSVRAELNALKPPGLELRLIDGTERRTHDKARSDLEWAHIVFVWGASELDHRVSNLYTEGVGTHRRKVVQIARRGIAALLNAGADHVERLR